MNCGLPNNNNPCKRDCEGRSPTCHSTCITYLEWKKEWDIKRIKERIKRNNESANNVYAYAGRRRK